MPIHQVLQALTKINMMKLVKLTIMQSLTDHFEVKSYPGLGTKLIMSKELTPVSEEVY
mgnify:CR=1 FL=1